jgi:hypothetical protein
MKKLIPSLLTSLVVGLAPAGARAETNSCTAVATLPAVISSPGIYCLKKDFVVNMPSGVAIQITSQNVVLDLNAHRLANSAGSTNTATAIESAEARITIKNGVIRRFLSGVRLTGQPFDRTQAHLVEDLRIDKTSLPIFSNGPAIIRKNWIAEAGPGTATFSAAILVSGDESRVIDNDIVGVTAAPGVDAFGILVFSDDVLAVNNRIDDSEVGIQFLSSSGKYRDNLTSAVTYPYLGGTDAGNNN